MRIADPWSGQYPLLVITVQDLHDDPVIDAGLTEKEDAKVVEKFGGPCRGRTYGSLIKRPAEDISQNTQQERSPVKREDS
jgi:hypothetical protein